MEKCKTFPDNWHTKGTSSLAAAMVTALRSLISLAPGTRDGNSKTGDMALVSKPIKMEASTEVNGREMKRMVLASENIHLEIDTKECLREIKCTGSVSDKKL